MNPLRLVILFFLFLPFLSLAQDTETITIKGKVYDADTEEPVSFANVFIKTAMLGTMADTLGKFELILEKKYANDTLFVSAIGYKLYSDLINRLDLSKDVMVEMDDTLIMLSEATALAYDNFEGLYWNTGKSAQPKLLLTCATRYMYNIAGFVKILKSEYGMPKVNANVFKWKNIDIPDLKMKKINITLTYLHCAYCPEETDLNITLALRDSKNRNLLDLRNDAEVLEDYFQSKLNQTFAQGVDYEILEKKGDIMYLKNDDKPYTGKCFGYYESGERGLKGEYVDGLKEGEWTYWYTNGQQKMDANYSKGMKQGKWTSWYSNGNVRIEANYINDKMNGTNKWYYENGKIKKEASYKNGVFYGKVDYDEKGNIVEKSGQLD